MTENSSRLSQHLEKILRLYPNNMEPWIHNALALSDQEILDQALQHDLPIFVSIDGSREENGIATVSISIVAPDIREADLALEWKDQIAKPLLIRSWRLPSIWGTSENCINMAESIGFILGDYTIPADIPVIFITDSNNARTLQRNLTSLNSFTHRQQVRQVKQGIDFSIANHLEFLTKRWPKPEEISAYYRRLYERGERVCKIWADAKTSRVTSTKNAHDDSSSNSSKDSTDDISDTAPLSYDEDMALQKKNSRFTFNHGMYDLLGTKIIRKVFSHQLDKDFEVTLAGRSPQPNYFVASANQIVDNAVEQTYHQLSNSNFKAEYNKICYPPFSPRWCFSFEGDLTNKGATKVFQNRLDMELIYRQQHREKQGLFFRLLPFIGLSAEQLGDESLLRNIVKMTATCWTRALYRYPPLVAQAWDCWYHHLTPEEQAEVPSTLPIKIGEPISGPQILFYAYALPATSIVRIESRKEWDHLNICICIVNRHIYRMLDATAMRQLKQPS